MDPPYSISRSRIPPPHPEDPSFLPGMDSIPPFPASRINRLAATPPSLFANDLAAKEAGVPFQPSGNMLALPLRTNEGLRFFY